MKIIYLHQYFVTPSMSGGTRSYEMARRLVAKGHDVHIITSWQGDTSRKGWSSEKIEGINVHWLPVHYSNHMSYSDRMKAFARFAMRAGPKAVQIGGDVVLATSTPLTIALPGVYAARRLKVPMVFEVRDLWPELPIAMGAISHPLAIYLAGKLERFAYYNSKKIVALSPGMAEGIKRAGYPESEIYVIPNSCDTDLFKSNDDSGGGCFFSSLIGRECKKVVLYPGTLGHINDVGYLVDIAASVVNIDSEIDFFVIGDGAQKEKIINKAKEMGVLGVNFHLFESMPKKDLVSAFRDASIVASLFLPLPEMESNSANKFFDALASGTPVMINYRGWQKEILKNSGCGLVLDRNVSKSAQDLVDYLADSESMEKASVSALSLANGEFNRDALAIQLEAVIVSAVQEGV
ncbi:glycosyltransferase family 4 protein [Alcanivorax sp. JB21]|uniref:glycosyltransferase family 4 protein n=1 Tax=Alcanivorax limicola TaxID=2874102 RepID=UPI001CBECF85|nr:glycosyltransferase family 4 protein [Alcanivorax limicola]MBZ2188137.1 glycosyltransferase family 4 protein [Alcanivorax limicola]